MPRHNLIPREIYPIIDAALETCRIDVRNNGLIIGDEARKRAHQSLAHLAHRIKEYGPQFETTFPLDSASEVEALGPVKAKWNLIALAKGLFALNEWARTGIININRGVSYENAKYLIQLAGATDLTLDFPNNGYDDAVKDALKEELKAKCVFGRWQVELELKSGAPLAPDTVVAKLNARNLELTFEIDLTGPYESIDLTEHDETLRYWVTQDSAEAWCLARRDRLQRSANEKILRAAKDVHAAIALEAYSRKYAKKPD